MAMPLPPTWIELQHRERNSIQPSLRNRSLKVGDEEGFRILQPISAVSLQKYMEGLKSHHHCGSLTPPIRLSSAPGAQHPAASF